MGVRLLAHVAASRLKQSRRSHYRSVRKGAVRSREPPSATRAEVVRHAGSRSSRLWIASKIGSSRPPNQKSRPRQAAASGVPKQQCEIGRRLPSIETAVSPRRKRVRTGRSVA